MNGDARRGPAVDLDDSEARVRAYAEERVKHWTEAAARTDGPWRAGCLATAAAYRRTYRLEGA